MVLGKGALADALAWRASIDRGVLEVATVPGNLGSLRWGKNIDAGPKAAAEYFKPDLIISDQGGLFKKLLRLAPARTYGNAGAVSAPHVANSISHEEIALQTILPRLEGDFALACATDLNILSVSDEAVTCVVVGGDAGIPHAGSRIEGNLQKRWETRKAIAFLENISPVQLGVLNTSGNPVLSVVGFGTTIEESRAAAYEAISDLQFDGIIYRTDIGLP